MKFAGAFHHHINDGNKRIIRERKKRIEKSSPLSLFVSVGLVVIKISRGSRFFFIFP